MPRLRSCEEINGAVREAADPPGTWHTSLVSRAGGTAASRSVNCFTASERLPALDPNIARYACNVRVDKLTIIMHDNSMIPEPSISGQLRRRRVELGLSLADVARRAGTSAATLSRYEHDWVRFETYTLRKLAVALGCELRIELRPKARRKSTVRNTHEACARLQRLFWDHALSEADLKAHPGWVVERVLEYGALEDIHVLSDTIGRKAFLSAVAAANRVSPRTGNFWRQILEMEGMSCTRKYSRNTAWNS